MSRERLKKIAGKVTFISAWVIFGAAFIVILTSSIVYQRAKVCNKINITVDHSTGLFFISEEDIQNNLLAHCGDSLNDMHLRGIDFAQLEANLETNPFIDNAEIYSNIKGDVNVEIEQKEPIIRVVNNQGVSYYIDRHGEKIPLSPNFTARVAVASGNVEKVYNEDQTTGSAELYKLAGFIHQDEFWQAQVEQIYVTEDGEFELIPKLGNHIIQIGEVENLENKFKKLMIFYKEILKNVDADKFRIINLKYKDQIVCTKNIYYGK